MMFAQLAPLALQRRHWYVNVIGWSPDHVPGSAVRVCPSWARPAVVGGLVFFGGAAAAAAEPTPTTTIVVARAIRNRVRIRTPPRPRSLSEVRPSPTPDRGRDAPKL